jgi:hypothetical protein
MKKDELNGQDPAAETVAAEDPNRYFGVRIFFCFIGEGSRLSCSTLLCPDVCGDGKSNV